MLLHFGRENEFSLRSTFATFAELNISDRPEETDKPASAGRKHYEYIKLTYPNGVTLTLPQGVGAAQLAEYVRIKI